MKAMLHRSCMSITQALQTFYVACFFFKFWFGWIRWRDMILGIRRRFGIFRRRRMRIFTIITLVWLFLFFLFRTSKIPCDISLKKTSSFKFFFHLESLVGLLILCILMIMSLKSSKNIFIFWKTFKIDLRNLLL